MQSVYITALFSALSVFGSTVVYADSWDITQTVEVNSDTTITQQSSNNSFQTVNAINLDSVSGVVSSASQSMTLGGNDLTLRQVNNTSSTQSVNYISAAEVTQASQTVSSVSNITLEVNNGSGNIQAINMTNAETVDELNQSVNADNFNFIGSGSNNIQAGNYLQTTNASGIAGNITQHFFVQNAGGVQYQQTGSDNIQAGNLLVRNPGFSGEVEQTFSVNQVTVSSPSTTDANNSIMAANYTK